MSPRSAVEVFEAVRDLPYAIDAAHDADSLERLGTGDCLAKSELLARRLTATGLVTRLVRWPYELPPVVPETGDLPERLDVHRAVEVLVGDEWILVDPTHDPPLAAGGLAVAIWDGAIPTPPAYEPMGPRLVEGRDDAEIQRLIARVAAWTQRCPPEILERWRSSHIAWLASFRTTAT